MHVLDLCIDKVVKKYIKLVTTPQKNQRQKKTRKVALHENLSLSFLTFLITFVVNLETSQSENPGRNLSP